nr:MAG: hypothetical protein [Microviridae sp.]
MRRPMSKRHSKKSFRRGAARAHQKNKSKSLIRRGGFRL